MPLSSSQLQKIRDQLERSQSWLQEIQSEIESCQSRSTLPFSSPALTKSSGQSILFYRDYGGFTGGHLKVWDYFNHVTFSQNYSPSIYFTPQSSWIELEKTGNKVELLTTQIARYEYLEQLNRARITVFLPNQKEGEGFYLPALEGMAVGTLVICPDCIGNRSFCISGYNCFRPDYRVESLLNAIQQALQYSQSQVQ